MDKGAYTFKEIFSYSIDNKARVWEKVLHIGGENGWYYGTVLWKLRGKIDKIFGGIGYRQGRKNPEALEVGDQIDFWRIIKLDQKSKILALQAEMSLPGKVFIKWRISESKLIQETRFLPEGIKGKAYWYMVRPLHYWIFYKMGKEISKG
ncbi:DUF2867 domain-containing protein [Mongoliibacter ruber]|uniref:Uncharacterized protein DUF2867 n=1 Tax=Mongoliibacter ruber TaxID=1750599 RepID=A0A2T0WSM8_9BACT|nr:DUF2867 domain-containing protein [Mongoliibacter ruber]PRY89696.1 uncharacterized protein DUF2867 [Mongoliibacter ruber]